uniref:ABC-type xenobiotic transporter n=1 Tax=Bursaphelenchus xylophilus TaxID=6326 RepID=A0A1I7SW83_BURXY
MVRIKDSDDKTIPIPEIKLVEETKNANFFDIYRYSSRWDVIVICCAVILSLTQGIFYSLNPIVFKDLTNALIEGAYRWDNNIFDFDDFSKKAMNAIWKYLIFGSAVFVFGFLGMSFWNISSERQVFKIRAKFFRALMRQDRSWFDKHDAGVWTTKMSDGIDRIKDGTGDKLGLVIAFFAQFIGGMTVSFTYSWKMSLVMLGLLPLILIAVLAIGFFSKKYIKGEQGFYGSAGSVAEEVLYGIRTVMAFNGQEKEIARYSGFLDSAASVGVKKGMMIGIGTGFVIFLLFGSMGFSFWYGTKLVNDGMDPGTVFAVFWAFMVGVLSLAQMASQIPAIMAANNAVVEVFNVINREPEINSLSDQGEKDIHFKGSISFSNVEFRYPSRPEVQVLKKINFKAEKNQVVALVGSSGSGKSTVISLLQRFYDVDTGFIHLDDTPISEINVRALRNMVSVVSQEPVLFSGTIEENLKLGNPLIGEKELIEATKTANAYEFINKLENKFQTRIGDGGIQLSGGQKQRIAIARALVRHPKVLLLDEATSALDTESERIVQEALKKASNGRTTIVVAHRLSTIRNADKILVFREGEIVEEGSHETLMAMNGVYSTLVKAQEIIKLRTEDDIEKVEEFERNELQRSIRLRRSTRHMSRALSYTSTNPEKDDEIDRLKDELAESHIKPTDFKTIVLFARPEWNLLFFAISSALLRGVMFPLFSIIYGQAFKAFATSDKDERMRQAVWNCVYFCILGVVGGITIGLGSYLFGKAGESLTKRLRIALFKNIVYQDGPYFDDVKHSPGRLSGRLATDAPNIRAAIDQRLADVVASFSAIVSGIVIAFSYGPAMAPIGILTSGCLVLIQTFLSQYLKKRGHTDALLAEAPSRLASEAIDKHRTVQTLTREDYFDEEFQRLIEKPHKRALFRGVIQSLTFALHASYVFFNFAAAYRYGVFLIEKSVLDPYTVFQVIEALNCATMTMLAFATYFPEYVRARLSAAIIFKMLEDQPTISYTSPNFIPTIGFNDWKFESVGFSYPTNPKRKIIKDIRFEVPKKKTLALVGVSGCGKSTIVQLLERYYDPDSGCITVNGININEISLRYLRDHIAVVGQEPILFNYSIKENISYGMEGVPFHMIQDAARLANADDFISNLPDGYETKAGEKGNQLSGGQKQRIAIARAIIRSPSLLLLDEATSALDSANELLVQEALDRVQEGRTTIVIAHRLTTIQNADHILVIQDGQIAEQGTHNQLLHFWASELKMIGMMNVPCESPTEFYSAPKSSNPQSTCLNARKATPPKQLTWSRKSSKRISVFVKRRLSHQVDYLKDGRKLRDGELVEKETAPKMWEKLLVRTFVHKIEDEIQSPVQEKRSPFINDTPQCTNSTWSLVSDHKLEKTKELEADRPRSQSCGTDMQLSRKFF